MIGLMVLGLVAFVAGSDLPCTRLNGVCQDYRYAICTAGYETGLCDGDANRRCCLNCNAACKTTETANSAGDGACNSAGGDCFHNTNYCSGYFSTGKCGGDSSRQCCESGSGTTGCYGDIRQVDTTGASCATASQDNLLLCGVSASRTMANTDLSSMNQYKTLINTAASQLCVDASVIAGIISRETRAGKVLGSNGYGADGHGYGLMQVDDRWHTLKGGPYSLEHIKQGTGILIDMIKGVESNHPSWTQNMALKGGISAYNAGADNVQSYENMDVGTTGGDYANDVTARSQYYSENGY